MCSVRFWHAILRRRGADHPPPFACNFFFVSAAGRGPFFRERRRSLSPPAAAIADAFSLFFRILEFIPFSFRAFVVQYPLVSSGWRTAAFLPFLFRLLARAGWDGPRTCAAGACTVSTSFLFLFSKMFSSARCRIREWGFVLATQLGGMGWALRTALLRGHLDRERTATDVLFFRATTRVDRDDSTSIFFMGGFRVRG